MSNELQRVRPAGPKPCSTTAWHELVLSMNSTAPSVLVRREHLDEVGACHQRHVHGPMFAAMPSLEFRGIKYYSVKTKELWDFVQCHGKVCGHVV